MMSRNGGWVGVFQNGHRGRTTTHHGGPQNVHAGNKIEKRLLRLLQAINHAEVIEQMKQSGRFPVGMYRQVNKLTHFIKPSSPHPDTTARVQQNTDEWMNCNLRILKNGSDQTISQKKPNLDPDNLANYRPISNLPFLSKILEKIVAKQLTSF